MSAVDAGLEAASDEELVDRLKRSREEWRAFEALVARHRARVIANCRFLTRSPSLAEDLAQEVFTKAFFGLPGFEGRASFRTWLHRLKVNHCLNFLGAATALSSWTSETPSSRRIPRCKCRPRPRHAWRTSSAGSGSGSSSTPCPTRSASRP